MEKELRDYFKIDDSHSKIRGFVVIRDADGKIIVKKENMIVKSGRQLILNAITGVAAFDMRNLIMMFSENSDFTEEDTVYNECYFDDKINVAKKTKETNPVIDTTECFIKFKAYVTSDEDKSLNSMGLCLENSEDNAKTLFSRVVFNTIKLSANSKLELTYYIYF